MRTGGSGLTKLQEITQKRRDRKLATARRRRNYLARKRRAKQRRPHDAMGAGFATGRRVLHHYVKAQNLVRRRSSSSLAIVEVPRQFSLATNPVGVIDSLNQLVQYAINPEVKRIHINQSACLEIDHAASAVLNVLGKELRDIYRLSYEGRYPSDPRLRRIVTATGLPRLFVAPDREFEELLLFELRTGTIGRAKATQSSEKEKVASEFKAYVAECLARTNRTVPETLTMSLPETITEVLGNVEEHSGLGRWWFSGHFEVNENPGQSKGELALINLGSSIAETIGSLKPETTLAYDLDRAVNRYVELDSSRTADDYRTFWALQGGVSRLRHREPDRGQGTVRLFQFFERISEEGTDPQMQIISGKTRIIVDRNATVLQRLAGPGLAKHEIPLNAANSLAFPPDRKAVHSIGMGFPGTIVALRFFL